MNIDLRNSLKSSLGIEDNSQVEVNFHIDTDDDNNPDVDGDSVDVEPITVPGDGESGVETEEASADTAEASDEVEQLEEAQDSLESLKTIVDRHIDNGTMTRMGLSTYRLALESIVPSHILEDVGITSLESNINTSKYHAGVLAQAELTEIQNRLSVVTMEANFDWVKKTKHKIAVFFKREAALEKRARALLSLAETSEHEQASNDNLSINAGKKTLSLHNITTLKWTDEKEFKEHVEHFCNLYNSMSDVKRGYDDEFTDNIFPESRKWPKDEDGNPVYKTFRIKLVRKNNLVNGHMFPKVEDKMTLPNLTPDACKDVLTTLINTLAKGKIMNKNIDIMLSVLESVMRLETSVGVDGNGKIGAQYTEKYPDGYVEMYETLVELKSLRIKVTTDILNYVNYSLTDREFV